MPRFSIASAALLTALFGAANVQAAPVAPAVKNIVLVHGAFADGSGWRAVRDLLVKDGYLFLAPAKFAADFAADLPPAQAQFMAISQMPVAGAAFGAPSPVAAWRDKSSYAIVATQDKALNPDLERWMYARAGSKVTEIKASHAVYISQPRAVQGIPNKQSLVDP